MNPDQRTALIEAQREAAAALDAGVRLAQRAKTLRHGGADTGRPDGRALGALLADPAAFWTAAAAVEGFGDGETVEPMLHANRFAAARMQVGDLDHARASLLGQAGWLSVLAVKLAARAEDQGRMDRAIPLLKLAMQAQRQAAQTLAAAAALNKLVEADAVTVAGY